MLIPSHRHTPADLEHWAICEKQDAARACMRAMERLEAQAMLAVEEFLSATPGAYVSVSWGKDSVVVAHLASRVRPGARCIWFPAGAVENPDCPMVRDAFLARFDVDYIEHEAAVFTKTFEGHDGAQAAFEAAAEQHGAQYVSGVRAQESKVRKIRMRRWGESTINTCAPIGWWKHDDVFAYLHKYDLPIHPAYACTMGGLYPREHIRVATIGGYRGTGLGRRQWEATYYRDEIVRIFGAEHLDGAL